MAAKPMEAQFNLQLTPELLKALKAYAESRQVSASAFVRTAIINELTKEGAWPLKEK
jgi:predicted HicB family RNase H-like nuclease